MYGLQQILEALQKKSAAVMDTVDVLVKLPPGRIGVLGTRWTASPY